MGRIIFHLGKIVQIHNEERNLYDMYIWNAESFQMNVSIKSNLIAFYEAEGGTTFPIR